MTVEENYRCKQSELYAVARMGWENYVDDLPAFSGFKGKYDANTAIAAIAALTAARALPDEQSRNAEQERSRIQLEALAKRCLNNWQGLKLYIRDTYPESERKPLLEAAGADFYDAAANQDWAAMISLLGASLLFINSNQTALENGGQNMPAGFVATYTNDKDKWEAKYATFLDLKEVSKEETAAKILANNAVYQSLIEMLDDGKYLFANDPVRYERYVFDKLLGYVTTAGPTGMRVAVQAAVTELPVANVSIEVQPGNYIATTDASGIVVLNMPEDVYRVLIEADGYKPVTVNAFDIKTGVVSRLDIVLEPMV